MFAGHKRLRRHHQIFFCQRTLRTIVRNLVGALRVELSLPKRVLYRHRGGPPPYSQRKRPLWISPSGPLGWYISILYLEGRLLIEIIAVPEPFTGFNHGLCRQEEHDKVNIR